MATEIQLPSTIFDYAAYGQSDGQCIYAEAREADKNRRERVLDAAKKLQGNPHNTAQYLDGLETGMKMTGASEASALRLRYEAAAVIASYGITVETERALNPQSQLTKPDGESRVVKEILDYRDLEAETSWQALVHTAREMRSTALNRVRLAEGLPPEPGRGNRAIRIFDDSKFEQVREQLIKRTAQTQALDLLRTAIAVVARTYPMVIDDEIETLTRMERKICTKIGGDSLSRVRRVEFGRDGGKIREISVPRIDMPRRAIRDHWA